MAGSNCSKVPLDVRLEQKITRVPESGCWIWAGYTTAAGYPRLSVNGKEVYVHRLMYSRVHGEIDSGMEICHRCDVPSCVNPHHLFCGTHADNMEDLARKGRWGGPRNLPKGERHHNSVYSESLVRSIKLMRKSGIMPKQISEHYGLKRSQVKHILSNKCWRWIE